MATCTDRFYQWLKINNDYTSDPGKYFPTFISRRLFVIIGITILIVIKRIQSVYSGFTFSDSRDTSLKILCMLERIGLKFNITGINVLRELKNPAIFVANHMSVLETLILPGIINSFVDVTFVVKKELLNYPVFRKLLTGVKVIPVSRKNAIEDYKSMVFESEKLFASNISLLVFPQKTRTLHFRESSFNSIGAKIAKRNNIPIIPIAVKSNAWGIGRLIKDFGKFDVTIPVKISIGEIVYPDLNSTIMHKNSVNYIKNRLMVFDGN